MNAHHDKVKETNNQSQVTAISKKGSDGESALQFRDNRPEAVVQRKLHEIANNSPRAIQFKAIQEMANNNVESKQGAQLRAMANHYSAHQPYTVEKKENDTGLPDRLKSGIENLSGYTMDDVKVHYNSDKPTQLNAHAYAQGTDIHIGTGQEKYLPHEAWHVVQQKQGRVKPSMQAKGLPLNDDKGLELEADVMGAKALQMMGNDSFSGHSMTLRQSQKSPFPPNAKVVQRAIGDDKAEGTDVRKGESGTPWKIVSATEKSGKWEYKVEVEVFGMKREETVTGDDEEWNVHIVKETPKLIAMRQVVTQNLKPSIQGSLEQWVKVGGGKISKVVVMDSTVTTNIADKYIWTGGSADCIAVAAHDGEKGFLSHGTQFSVMDAVRMALKTSNTIYLSSKHFSNPQEAPQTSSVIQIFDAFKSLLELEPHQINASKYSLHIYNTGMLALNGDTGEVLSRFTPPDSGIEDWELELIESESQIGSNLNKKKQSSAEKKDVAIQTMPDELLYAHVAGFTNPAMLSDWRKSNAFNWYKDMVLTFGTPISAERRNALVRRIKTEFLG